MQKIRNMDEIGMIKIRQQIALRTVKREQCGMLIDKILNMLPVKIGKYYKPDLSSNNHEEISRRISLLNTPKFVVRCVTTANATLQILEFPVSSSEMLFQIAGLMMTDAIIVPGIAPMACVLVTQRLTEIVFKLITGIRDEHIKRIRNERERCKTNKKVGILSFCYNNSQSLEYYDKCGRVMFSEAMEISEKTTKDEFKVRRSSLQLSRTKDKMVRKQCKERIFTQQRNIFFF